MEIKIEAQNIYCFKPKLYEVGKPVFMMISQKTSSIPTWQERNSSKSLNDYTVTRKCVLG